MLCAVVMGDANQNQLVLSATAVLIAVVSRLKHQKESRKRRKRIWMRELLIHRSRLGLWNCAVPQLEKVNSRTIGTFANYFRMDASCFELLLAKVAPIINREDTQFRQAISPQERLAVTLRYLATGCSFTELHYSHRISLSSISHIIPETCEAVYNCIKEECLLTPKTSVEWQEISLTLQERWQFPNVLGALDGKDVIMVKPWHVGSNYHNYKGSESIVLLALCDAYYRYV